MADLHSNTTKHSHFRSQQLTRPKRIVTGTRSSATAAKRVRAAGARTNGPFLPDYAAGSDKSGNRSRSSCRQARVRCDDADEKDRHRCNRGGAPRLRLRLRRRASRKRKGNMTGGPALPLVLSLRFSTERRTYSRSHVRRDNICCAGAREAGLSFVDKERRAPGGRGRYAAR